jgi:hypothetical protein
MAGIILSLCNHEGFIYFRPYGLIPEELLYLQVTKAVETSSGKGGNELHGIFAI